jgi:hypothetical protein
VSARHEATDSADSMHVRQQPFIALTMSFYSGSLLEFQKGS